MSILKNIILKIKTMTREPRERLSVMYVITTDKKEYVAYNTQTIQGQDCVNIEIIEKISGGKEKIILEKEILDDSWGAMCGTAFSGLVIDSRNHLMSYIKERGEFVISENNLF